MGPDHYDVTAVEPNGDVFFGTYALSSDEVEILRLAEYAVTLVKPRLHRE